MWTISRREGATDVLGVDVDLGLARDAIEVVEVDLIRAEVAADAILLAATDAITTAAVDVVVVGDDVVDAVAADAIFVAVEDATAAFTEDAIFAAGEGVGCVVEADAGASTTRNAATVGRSVPQLSMK